MHRWLLSALVGATLLPCPALAGILMPRSGEPLQIRKQALTIQVRDQVARATVDEVFENSTDQALEGTYRLPLPDGAAISGFATWVDGQRIESRVEEKAEAQKSYDDAKSRHAEPALLEQEEPGTFKTRVDGIPPHGTKRVEAAFAQILPYDSGVVTLRVPLAPRSQGGRAETVGTFQLDLEVSDQKRIVELAVLSHPAAGVSRAGPSLFKVTLASKGERLDKDLVVTYRTESSRLGLSFVPFKPNGEEEGYFLLLASPQELTSAADIVLKDVVFVFDTSGSMQEEGKIQQAREALKRCLANLNDEDRFGVIAFNDSTSPFQSKLVPATATHREQAMAFADSLSAGGSTNISAALGKGLDMLGDGERPKVLVFMTDGHPTVGVTHVDEIARLARSANGDKARIFAFGVGSDVHRTFLERLARENRGSHDFVERGQSIETVVGGFYAKIARPVLSDLAFDFGEVVTSLQYPDVLPDLYKGSQLVLVGRYRSGGKVQAALTGTLNGKKLSLPFEAEFPAQETTNGFVARLWAQRRVDFLLSQTRLDGEREEMKAEIILLAKKYGLVTPYTSMVAVRRPDQAIASVFPARVKPGDPTIWVRAPRDARSVTASLSFAGRTEVKTARWDEDHGLWSARFLVPAGTAEGTYPLAVHIEHADGRSEEHALAVSIDVSAPAIAAHADAVRAGELLRVSATAMVSPADLARVLASRSDRYEGLKALFDIRRVRARLWDGREVELGLDPDGLGFAGVAETGSDLAPGRYSVLVTAQDYAGNLSQATALVEVR
ncbi:MAG: VWA domain-containing protein [Deltaproteobacteria bacterium]|nr:VWA domain-containing protein [Deltaproteobacteria bacterium]